MTLAKALHVTFIACALLTGLATAPARAASEQQDLIDKARITLDDVKKDKEFGNTQSLLKRAKAVFIVPSLFKGGFFVGGEGGSGVFLVRQSDGSWSYPAFYTLASASFGLQIGAETSELVLIVLSDKANRAFMSDEFKVGVDAGLAIVTLGSGAEAATTSNMKADIVVWSSSTGAYAGLTLNGSVIKPRMEYNAAYYGKTESPADIVLHGAAKNPQADSLRKTLASLG
ncbi:MAG TPA: lipid-binding SYLF domain-containing protein [Patescibacteria group bacterium]|nr:lipid-binding SYLF domain-containing protein [Patescibacteria group bacterium]